jgi:UDP-2,4-diacetamido-2,4,6-trideoxy-beta-L-altropyranose hydrolase
MKLLFCVLAGREFGYGHLNRCLSIADCARKHGMDTAFLVLGEGADIPRKRGHESIEALWPGAVPDIPVACEKALTITIFDVAHPSIFPRQSELVTLLRMQRKLADKLIAIDSMGDYSFATAFPSIPVDVIVVPYVGGKVILGTPAVMLVGPEYAVLSPDYADLPVRQINEIAERVLVTFGGSDPQELTLIVLEALSQIKRKLIVRVVIGPLFAAEMTKLIEVRAKSLYHKIELLHSPHSLVEHMRWADIAVAASGLVKYELAASGTPGILVSIDEAHNIANRPFSQERLQRDLGVTADPSVISHEIEDLLGSFDERMAMAERGMRLIDAKGGERLVVAVKSLFE